MLFLEKNIALKEKLYFPTQFTIAVLFLYAVLSNSIKNAMICGKFVGKKR